jgi:hypothetical protein
MIRTYIAAEKLGIEGLMNGIQDRYRKLYSHWAVTPDELGLLPTHGRRQSLMRPHALKTVAWELRNSGWDEFKQVHHRMWNQYLEKDEENCDELFKVFVDNSKTPWPFDETNACEWHVHIDTPSCSL